ncbi:MAG: hypothetical protein IKC73_03630 [Clostridia bacterium]|nr:hypothetical protein [Clostridia bacterium]
MREEALAHLFALLPTAVTAAVRDMAACREGLLKRVSEIRLRADRIASLTVGGENYPLPVVLTEGELSALLVTLCRGSVYAFRDSLCEGYLDLGGGVRVGVGGRALTEGGRLSGVVDVTSLVFRIPTLVRGVGEEAYRLFCREGGGMLLYSPPGVGKTTLLRDLCRLLSTGAAARRVVIVDTRGELGSGYGRGALVDILTGYPRAVGIEIAVRTLSPEVVAVDEIGSRREAEAILGVAAAGVPLLATAHAATLREARGRPGIAALLRAGIFRTAVGLYREGAGVGMSSEIIGQGK